MCCVKGGRGRPSSSEEDSSSEEWEDWLSEWELEEEMALFRGSGTLSSASASSDVMDIAAVVGVVVGWAFVVLVCVYMCRCCD